MEVLAWCSPDGETKDLIHRKILQMADFLASECVINTESLIIPLDKISGDLIPAKYKGAYMKLNAPTTIASHLPWFLVPVGYAALHGIDSCKSVYSTMVHSAYSYPELSIGSVLSESYWEGFQDALIFSEDSTISIQSDGLEGLRSDYYYIRLRDNNGRETMHPVLSSDGQSITFSDTNGLLALNPSNYRYDWVITGPVVNENNVRSMSDKAIKSWSVNIAPLSQMENDWFNWSDGQHFNTWFKDIGMILNQWDYPFMIQMMIDNANSAQQGTTAE